MIEPKETDSIDCHLQQIGMGTLTCRAARQTGDSTTNEVTPTLCFNCDAGKIFREVGCDAVTPKIKIWSFSRGSGDIGIDSLFCKIRKRETSLEYCKTCALVTAETTRKLVTNVRGLFQANEFYAAYKDIEKAREAFRDGNFENTITRSISCLESVIKIIHEKLDKPLPNKKQLTDLWKSAREILQFDELDKSESTQNLLNSLSGLTFHYASMRNSLSDAHGRGNLSQQASEIIAELAINTSATLSTTLIRQFVQVYEGKNE
jgi:hypothetical protein